MASDLFLAYSVWASIAVFAASVALAGAYLVWLWIA